MDRRSLKGRLLVATARLRDPNFFRTVVLMLEHEERGAVGVVLNRPTSTPLADAIPRWAELAGRPAMLFIGGPVQRGAAVALGRWRSAPPPEETELIIDTVGAIDLSADPDTVATKVSAIRVFSGYAGWSGGQLEAEISQGAWAIVTGTGTAADALATDPARLWAETGRRRQDPAAGSPSDPWFN